MCNTNHHSNDNKNISNDDKDDLGSVRSQSSLSTSMYMASGLGFNANP